MTSARRVEATYTNHDTNLVDVTLRVTAPAHGAVAATAGAGRARDEVVHTTANHPWLTADHGWLPASFMRIGEPVVRADGTTATVVAVRAVPGAAPMWDLTVGDLHDFAVGDGQYVVHNVNSCDPTSTLRPGPYAGRSIEATRGAARNFTDAEYAQIDEIGRETGCHTCGTRDPGGEHFVPDHQPANSMAQPGEPQRLYPQCQACSRSQGGQASRFLVKVRLGFLDFWPRR